MLILNDLHQIFLVHTSDLKLSGLKGLRKTALNKGITRYFFEMRNND